jgi:hypothetical protein
MLVTANGRTVQRAEAVPDSAGLLLDRARTTTA